ncbi:MAG: TIGR03915 family putative DNA repair protein [Tepidisphaeraceae bacterium]
MRSVAVDHDFDAWRTAARRLLAEGITPAKVHWTSPDAVGLFTPSPLEGEGWGEGSSSYSAKAKRVDATVVTADPLPDPPPAYREREQSLRVPAAFLDLAKLVLCHRDTSKFALLYRTLWRLTHGEPHLLQNAVDDDTRQLANLEKSVRRDCHKMTAFVRFKKIVDPDGHERFVAWYRPDHFIVRRMAKFFVDRFRTMHWAILTPDASVEWTGQHLHFGDGVPVDPLIGDAVEDLWTTYYANIFNPARIKLKAMRAEMPKKHWPTLPETRLIPQMLADAPARVQKMLDATPKVALLASDYVPATTSLRVLHAAAEKCRACGHRLPRHASGLRRREKDRPRDVRRRTAGQRRRPRRQTVRRPQRAVAR